MKNFYFYKGKKVQCVSEPTENGFVRILYYEGKDPILLDVLTSDLEEFKPTMSVEKMMELVFFLKKEYPAILASFLSK